MDEEYIVFAASEEEPLVGRTRARNATPNPNMRKNSNDIEQAAGQLAKSSQQGTTPTY